MKVELAGCLRQLQAQCRAECLVMSFFTKKLQIHGAAAATQNLQEGHQQQQPLGVAHASALATFRQRLKKSDQISTDSGVGQRTGAVPTKPAQASPHQPPCAGFSSGSGGRAASRVIGSYTPPTQERIFQIFPTCEGTPPCWGIISESSLALPSLIAFVPRCGLQHWQ